MRLCNAEKLQEQIFESFLSGSFDYAFKRSVGIVIEEPAEQQVIVETFMNLKNGGTVDFNLMSETLFAWSKKWISENS